MSDQREQLRDSDPDPWIVGQLQAAERHYREAGDGERESVMYGAWHEIERLRAERDYLKGLVRIGQAMGVQVGVDWVDFPKNVVNVWLDIMGQRVYSRDVTDVERLNRKLA